MARRLAIAFFRVTSVMLGIGIAVVLYTVPVLAVSEVEVDGNQHLTPETILGLADVEGHNVLALDLPGARARLLSNPWVREATVRRRLPSTVAIHVNERRATAVWQTGYGRFLMADDGVLLEPAPVDPGLPVILDKDGLPQQVGSKVPSGPASLAQSLLRDWPQAGSDPATAFEYQADNGLTVVTAGGRRVVFGDATDLDFKLATYQELLKQGDLGKLKVKEIDLRFGARPVLRPEQTPTPTPSAAPVREGAAPSGTTATPLGRN